MCCGCGPGGPRIRGMGLGVPRSGLRYKMPYCRKCLILLRKPAIVVQRS